METKVHIFPISDLEYFLDGHNNVVVFDNANLYNECPFCGKHGTLTPLFAINPTTTSQSQIINIFVQCPQCCKVACITLEKVNQIDVAQISPTPKFRNGFPNEIKELSPKCFAAYDQAMEAALHGLNLLVGMGIRNALEHLLYDFISKVQGQDPERNLANKINQLGFPIDSEIFVFSSTVRVVGNDETHIIPETELSIDDMKKSFSYLVYFLQSKLLSSEYYSKLPDYLKKEK